MGSYNFLLVIPPVSGAQISAPKICSQNMSRGLLGSDIFNRSTANSDYSKGISAKDNLNVNKHPNWSQITILDVGSNGTTQFNEVIWVDPKIWDMDTPTFTCSPPCHAKIPPWTGATSVVPYPLVTVSDGTWTSTITQAPLTVTEWIFDVVTLSQGSNNRKRAADAFWPKPVSYIPSQCPNSLLGSSGVQELFGESRHIRKQISSVLMRAPKTRPIAGVSFLELASIHTNLLSRRRHPSGPRLYTRAVLMAKGLLRPLQYHSQSLCRPLVRMRLHRHLAAGQNEQFSPSLANSKTP